MPSYWDTWIPSNFYTNAMVRAREAATKEGIAAATEEAQRLTEHANRTDIGDLFKGWTAYLKDTGPWKTLSQAVVEKASSTTEAQHSANAASYRIKDVIGNIPGKVRDKLNNLCGADGTCTQKISDNKILALLAVGIPLSFYLYTKFKGTSEDKENMERKLRHVQRQMNRKNLRELTESMSSLTISRRSKDGESSSSSSSTRRRRSSNRKSVRRR